MVFMKSQVYTNQERGNDLCLGVSFVARCVNLGVGGIISEFVQLESLTFWRAGEEFDPIYVDIASFLERSKLGC